MHVDRARSGPLRGCPPDWAGPYPRDRSLPGVVARRPPHLAGACPFPVPPLAISRSRPWLSSTGQLGAGRSLASVHAVRVYGVDHGQEVLVGDVVHNAVAGGRDPSAPGLHDLHMLLHVSLHIGGSAADKRPGEIDVAPEAYPVAIAPLVVPVIHSCGIHGGDAVDPHVIDE